MNTSEQQPRGNKADNGTDHRPRLTDEQLQELQRRLADDDANPDDVIPWEQVREEALARFRK